MLSKSGFTLELINEMMSVIPDIGVEKFAQKIQENHMNRYLKLQQRYYEHCYQYQSNKNSLSTIDSYFSSNLQNDLQKFSEFEDPKKYQGSCPSSTLI